MRYCVIILFFTCVFIAQEQQTPISVVIVEQQSTDLLPIATAICAKSPQKPLLLILPFPNKQLETVARIGTGKVVILGRSRNIYQHGLKKTSKATSRPEVIHIPKLMNASWFLAQKFWKTSDEVIITSAQNPETLAYATLFACSKKIPIITWESDTKLPQLQRMKIKKVFTVNHKIEEIDNCEVIDDADLRMHTFAQNKSKKKLVIAHSRDPVALYGVYWSISRGAFLYLTNTTKGTELETQVYLFLQKHNWNPHFITILAHDDIIFPPKIDVKSPEEEQGEYSFNTELFMSPVDGCLSPFAVGRVPFQDPHMVSLFFMYTSFRKQLLQKQKNHVTLIANADVAKKGLPLGEMIAMVTAAEFKNRGVITTTHYRKPSDQEETIAALKKSHLLIFEGHANKQNLFQSERNDKKPKHLQGKLDGQAFVFLQSCYSLRDITFSDIFDKQGSGFIGSSTPIHSASGAAFAKCFSDYILQKNISIGEALCNTRNYFICLANLRRQRQHNEVEKLLRVAYSFRLWGDPELKVFPRKLKPPKKEGIQFKLTDDKVVITTPKKTVIDAENHVYSAKLFSKVKVAGLLKKIPNKKNKRLASVYFAKIPIKKSFLQQEFTSILHPDSTDIRAAFMYDLYKKNIYVLYLPKKTVKNTVLSLQFIK